MEPLLMEEEHDVVLSRFVAEAGAAERLAAAGLATRLNLILSGPPGTGKTLTAGHIAARLNRPFYVARLDALVSSLLGDTAKNVRMLLDYVQASGGVLLLDEFDAIAKQRDDARDVGELKRVVNALLQALDRLDHRCVIIAATNHPQLLDPAVWRRFPYRLDMGLPGSDLRRDLWGYYLDLGKSRAAEALAHISQGMSCSDIREVALAARRTTVISDRPIQLSAVVEAVVSCASGKFILPRMGDLPADRLRDLRKKVAELHNLSPGDVGALFQITRQGADKSLKAGRQIVQSEVGGAGQSSSAAQDGRNPRGRQGAGKE
ncbi:ATP-binding protein [Arenibaculum sp.]|jgi:SpoVK/Ycf46/Vps4 family AAA+-type ATPase|uniref:AAA family ATPase n=1 Tax=Arenibaculum sp. TaxID=2865862 RepID=UPI002E12C6D6|nr:ATP-binding protein [Arenibaculum sp.]